MIIERSFSHTFYVKNTIRENYANHGTHFRIVEYYNVK